jgi:two-component system OmpR family response regulator
VAHCQNRPLIADSQTIKSVSFLAPFSGLRVALLAHTMEFTEQPVIFVVEDNLIYQNLIAKELESISRNIHFYTTGEACVSELDKQPSVIVLDYNLDGQMNGLDTLQQVRDINPQIYVILFSSQKGLNTKEIFLQYGSFDFLEKNSLSLRTLHRMVSCVITSDKSLGN